VVRMLLLCWQLLVWQQRLAWQLQLEVACDSL
jgi:hypothetical protein